ncbi:hypothetical protein [uncultured Maribacter sp.]|uniref:hypothetical protein n=1 Tax=uncultured Maribacter sp. TaxID=431308 RepID=UPI00260B23F1|nr:hypothetical protein [uncultured Maribacter sp.]
MNHKRLTNPFLFGLVVFLFFSSSLSGQTQEYSGPFAIEKYAGIAEYNYYLISKDTVLEGDFKMYRSNLDLLINKEDSSFLFKGAFKENYPIGDWIFQFGDFKTDKSSQLVNYQYRVNINGIQEEAKGKIKQGKPDGLWVYTVNHIKNSEIEKTTFKSTITFDKGIPQKDFSIENEQNTLVGRFLRNGLAHDQWSLFSSNAMGTNEDWNFSDGILKNIQINDSRNKTIPIYTLKNSNTKTIHLDKRYLKAIQLQIALNGEDSIYHGNIEQLLKQNNDYYKKIDGILSKLGKSNFSPELKVKVPYYPLDSVEVGLVKTIVENNNSSKKISEVLLRNTQLNILKLSDSESFYYYNIINEITNKFVNPIANFVSYNEQQIIEFFPREAVLQSLWEGKIPSSKTITVANDLTNEKSKKTYELYTEKEVSFATSNSLEKIAQIASNVEKSLVRIQEIVVNKLTKEQRQQELISLEETLISDNTTLSNYIDSTANAIHKKYVPALQSIKAKSKEQLSIYATVKDNGLKLEKAKSILACNKTYLELAKTTANIPVQVDSLQKIYIDKIWNPFTATLMDEVIKKQITNAYDKVVIPHFLEHVESYLDCEQAKELNTQIKATHKDVLALRNKDTHKLERKLKKEQNPKTIMELFHNYANTKDH